MSFGYLGDTSTKIKQQVKNQGVISVAEAYELEKAGQLSGSLELIQEQTVSGVTVIDFTSIQETEYDVHLLHTKDIVHTSTAQTRLQLFESGTLETAQVYQYAFQQGQSDSTFSDALRDTTESFIYVTYSNNGTNTGDIESSFIYLYNLGNSARFSHVSMHSIFQDNGVIKFQTGGGFLPQTSTVDGIRLDFQSQSTNGTVELYGVKQL
jgi:hypothetical protein